MVPLERFAQGFKVGFEGVQGNMLLRVCFFQYSIVCAEKDDGQMQVCVIDWKLGQDATAPFGVVA